jgi:hypothetical protein
VHRARRARTASKITAGVITSAALLLVGVFALLGTLDSVPLRQMASA